MTDIRELRLVNWDVEGSVVGVFDRMRSLKVLDLSTNRIEGPLPALSSESHPQITQVILKSNEFSGQIPSSYGSLDSLGKQTNDCTNLLHRLKHLPLLF